jgi:hypothetical protein
LYAVVSAGFTSISSSLNVELGKLQKLSFLDNWLIGFAGTPDHFLPVRTSLFRALEEIRGTIDPKQLTDETIRDTLLNAYRTYRRKCIEEECKARCDDMTLGKFRREGPNKYGEVEFNRVNKEFSDYNLDLDLLVAGFNQYNSVVMLRIERPGIATPHVERYDAIGTGADLATAYLDACGFRISAPIEEVMCRVLEAKIFSESVPSVGTATFLIRMQPDGTTYRVTESDCNAFRKHVVARAPRTSPARCEGSPSRLGGSVMGRYSSQFILVRMSLSS